VLIVAENAQISFSGNFSHCLISGNSLEDNNMLAPAFPVAETKESLLHLEISSSQKGDKQLTINASTAQNPLLAIPAPAKNIGLLTDQLSFFELRNRELEITRLKKSRNSNDILMRIVNPEEKKTFAIMEPMFSFSGFSLSDINEGFTTPVNTAKSVRLKLKTQVLPWSVNTIILHHK
jgi:alpha-mannosidase